MLGSVRATDRSGGDSAPAGAMPRRLLLALALAGAEGRSVGALTDDLWPDDPPRNPRAAIQMLVSRVRATAADGLLESTVTGYRVIASDLALAERAGAAGAEEALALWRGEPGADLDQDALADELLERATRARVRLLRLAGQRLLDEGRPAAAVPLLERLVEALPLDGPATALLMRAAADDGRVDAALGAFAAHRERVADALGADPDPDLVRLNTALLRTQASPTSAELVGVRAATTPLLGREPDLVLLGTTVPAHRLTSIVGTGGLGKTRLAHETALRLADRYERIVFAELAGAQEDADVELVVGAAVGARPVQRARRLAEVLPPDLPTRTREALAARRTLLVLDNCEHVVDAAASLTADLLGAVPGLTVLTTSRVPLLLPGEAVVAPRPLDADTDAAALFIARATAARPGVSLDLALVERVCSRLDGLPLAIELAAARLRSMALPELDARLADRFAVLVGGDRTAPDRHRTLLAVIEWSRRLLSPAAADALTALAVFPDGFTASAADALLGTDAAELLTELVDQSLLTVGEARPGRSRYRMLETVREYGLRELRDTGRLTDALARFDAWAVRFARATSPGLLAGLDPRAAGAVAEEEETLLAIVRRDARTEAAVAALALLTESWLYRGEFEPIAGVLPALLEAGRVPPASPDAVAETVRALAIGTSVALIASSPEALRALALLRRVVRRADVSPGFWTVFARELLLSPDFTAGVGALDALSADPDPLVAAFALMMRSQLAENAGRLDAALDDLTAADAITTRHGYTWLRHLGRINIASLRSQRGEAAAALAVALRTQREIEELGVETDVRQLEWLVAACRLSIGEVDEAERGFERLAESRGRGGAEDEADNRVLAAAGLAEVATVRRDVPLALARWDEVLAIQARSGSPWRLLAAGGALAARVELGVPVADLAVPYRRLRTRLIAVARLQSARIDAPVTGSGLVGLAAALRPVDPEAARGLLRLGVALAARRDLPSVARALAGVAPAEPPGPGAAARVIALLRSPAVRRGPGG
ncbi:putative ATPase [Amnibacterium kyonggiense]|uniref:Putative ATPase n=1 Tax=Amnibacterium kyonggiense TaxID=595671 RepID=A0A4R7FLL0_9MICO|nr:putative ATPase [Amnibacterium kyonggiense]